MPTITAVSYMSDSRDLREPTRSRGALALTQREASVAFARPADDDSENRAGPWGWRSRWAVAAVVCGIGVGVVAGGGCASPRGRVGAGDSIDFRDGRGTDGSL